jgi:hypothetical protein
MAGPLTLGGITFDAFSTPRRMGAGGKHALVVHKLPGGSRVIDTLGPDEDNIAWDGEFFGNSTMGSVLALDGMRAAGQVISLTFAGQFRSVIIDHFSYRWRREPVWAEYNISCIVYQNPSFGNLGGAVAIIDTLILGDLALAIGP